MKRPKYYKQYLEYKNIKNGSLFPINKLFFIECKIHGYKAKVLIDNDLNVKNFEYKYPDGVWSRLLVYSIKDVLDFIKQKIWKVI